MFKYTYVLAVRVSATTLECVKKKILIEKVFEAKDDVKLCGQEQVSWSEGSSRWRSNHLPL